MISKAAAGDKRLGRQTGRSSLAFFSLFAFEETGLNHEGAKKEGRDFSPLSSF
jgi:hypothetical protein